MDIFVCTRLQLLDPERNITMSVDMIDTNTDILTVERADFDCKLFGKKVGRLELNDGIVQKVMSGSEMLLDAMKAAYTSG